MKLKIVVLASLFFLCLPFTAFSIFDNQLKFARESLISLNKGGIYVTKIDKIIDKYKYKESILEKLLYRIEKLKNKDLSDDTFVLLDYIELKIKKALYDINETTSKYTQDINSLNEEEGKDEENNNIENKTDNQINFP